MQSSPIIPEDLSPDLELLVAPAVFLQVRHVGTGQEGRLEVLLKWHGLPDFEATWEEAEAINARFPKFHLVDKVSVLGWGNVIHCTHHPMDLNTYNTRGKRNEDSQGVKQSKGKQHM